MLFTLSTSHEIGLAVVGSLFIAFALLSSFFFPRFKADFPTKKGLRWYIPLSFVFFIAMLGAVLVFGKENKVALAGITTGPESPAYANGNPVAGKAVFKTAGCTACHTFTPAGSTGTIGPDLDQLALYAQQAGKQLRPYTVNAIISPPRSDVPGAVDAMPTTFGTSLGTKKIADVVAFLDAPIR
jgi:mono/diheme cytochrome c family protein